MSRYVFKLGNTVLPHNPASITTKRTVLDNTQRITVSAEGDFYGIDRARYYDKLNEYMSDCKKMTVCMPEFGVINADIKELVFSVSDIPNLISYKMTLEGEYASHETLNRVYTLQAQETLWSLCDRLKLDLSEITMLNAGHINSFVLNAGDSVRLPVNKGETE